MYPPQAEQQQQLQDKTQAADLCRTICPRPSVQERGREEGGENTERVPHVPNAQRPLKAASSSVRQITRHTAQTQGEQEAKDARVEHSRKHLTPNAQKREPGQWPTREGTRGARLRKDKRKALQEDQGDAGERTRAVQAARVARSQSEASPIFPPRPVARQHTNPAYSAPLSPKPTTTQASGTSKAPPLPQAATPPHNQHPTDPPLSCPYTRA